VSVLEQMVGTLVRVIRMNDQLMALTEKVNRHQQRIEDMNTRVIRLETALELGLARSGGKRSARPRLPGPDR